MTSLVLLAVLLAAGWYFYRQWRYTRFEALHHPGHPQYFGAALCSVYLSGMSVGLHALAMRYSDYGLYLGKLQAMLPLQVIDKQTAEGLTLHLGLTLWCLSLATVLPIILNDPLVRVRSLAQLIASRLGGIDAIEDLAMQCYENGSLTALTLKSGKVNVGYLDEFTGPTVGKDWVGITPVASGFRDDKAKLSLTTFYDMKLPEEASFEIFQVIISMRQLVSAQAFDLDLYKRLQQPDATDQQTADVQKFVFRHSTLVVDSTRHGFYLGLPVLLLLAPYAGLKSTVGGLTLVLLAGVSSLVAERLRISATKSEIEEHTPTPEHHQALTV
ncbi:hypothetical protein J7J08_04510 [Stenotrophomonas sp. ISL-67]|uniref:hypothetical protein n=1 Tax=Stenotrophomonas sp. ISL-67 TaxID=2819171 RepID=UPI001BE90034|nr:hypothetical protein [Stenotrophomonas sp. ISL-67]